MRAEFREPAEDEEGPRDWGQLEALTTRRPAGALRGLALEERRQPHPGLRVREEGSRE